MLDQLRSLKAIHTRHPNVHQHNVGQKFLHGVHHAQPVRRFTNYVDLRHQLQQSSQSQSSWPLVIGNENADSVG
jgi:hypothetical protein